MNITLLVLFVDLSGSLKTFYIRQKNATYVELNSFNGDRVFFLFFFSSSFSFTLSFSLSFSLFFSIYFFSFILSLSLSVSHYANIMINETRFQLWSLMCAVEEKRKKTPRKYPMVSLKT